MTVPLADQRVLWLFGDSFVARGTAGTRREATFVRNSVAVQRGNDPSRAELRFYAGRTADSAPASFFAEEGASWFWPGHGLYLEQSLTLFLERMQADPAPGGLGFHAIGWTAVRVQNASDEPDAWRLERLKTPDTGELGVAGVALLLEGEQVLAYAVREPGDHAVMLMRWSRDDFLDGNLMRPQYWSGPLRGWTLGAPAVVLDQGATELSVSCVAHKGCVQVQSHGFGAAPVALRFSPAPTGPFGGFLDLYRPPEAKQPGTLLYAARAHPELEGADMVITYASNSLDPAHLLDDLGLYFPRFVRVRLP